MDIPLQPVITRTVSEASPQKSTLLENQKQLSHAESAAIHSEVVPRDPNARPEVFRWLAQEILFVLTATMTIAMPSFLQGSILIAAPAIQRNLSMTTVEVTWMMAASSWVS